MTVSAALVAGLNEAVVDRISEQLQSDAAMMHRFADAGLLPGRRVKLMPREDSIEITTEGGTLLAGRDVSDHIFVRSESVASVR